jgi:hypothetical protein
MVVGFATNYAISAYPHYSCELKSRSRKVFSIQRLQGTCDKSVVFSETPVSSTNKTEIFLKVAVGDLYMCPIYSTSGTQKIYRGEGFMVMVFKATFNHVSVL